MALVNYEIILKVQAVRDAYLAAEERDVQATAAKKGGKKQKPGSDIHQALKSQRPTVMRLAPASFMAQFREP